MKTKIASLGICLLATSALVSPVVAFAQETTVAPEAASADEVTEVVIKRGRNLPNTMRRTAEVTSILTNADLQRSGDGTAAAALTRVTGLSLVEGRFVYVRGLGERYSSALLNGSPLPSPEPLQRVVPLDLFPSGILNRVSVQKTYSAEYPGEFGGGVIDLQTLSVPREPFLSLSIGTGGNSEATFKDGVTHYGSDTDPIGFDDGARSLPSPLRDAFRSGKRINSANYTDQELQRIGRSLTNAPLNLIQQTDNLPANFDISLTGGNAFDLGGGRLGVIGLIDFSNDWTVKNGIQQGGEFQSGSVEIVQDYDYQTTENNVGLNGLLTLGYERGNHDVQWTNLYVRNTTKRTKVLEGEDVRGIGQRRVDSTGWYQRQLTFTQVSGRHELKPDWRLRWRASYARTTRDVPYEKSLDFGVDGFGYYHDGSSNLTRFSLLTDEVTGFGFDLTHDFSLGNGRDGRIVGGYDYTDNSRESEVRALRFRANGPLGNAQYSRPDYLFSDVNIYPNGLVIEENTGADGAAAYDGSLKVNAVYAKVDVEIIPLVRLAAGLRYEDGEQEVTLRSLFVNENVTNLAEPIKEDYVLPSATVTWNFADDMQARFGLSKTIGRPQFREMARQAYLDPDQDRTFIGNPYLVNTEITNFDARYEWYYAAGQHLTAGLFYKKLENPVEAYVLDTGSNIQQTYINAPEATLYGLEFDYKQLFDSPWTGRFFDGKQWLLQGNYTWTDSEVKAGDEVIRLPSGNTGLARENIIDGSRLQGQSEHVVNLQFGWEHPDVRSTATLLLTYVSERSSARGRPGEPDLIQEPGAQLDFVWRKGFDAFGRALNFGLEVRNLLDTDYEEYQELNGKAYINKYKLGQSVSFSLSTDF